MKSMMICCLWACSIGILLAASIDPFEQEWTNFKQKYGKTYRTVHEEQSRKQIFADNLELINNHNSFKFEKGLSSYQLGVNQFADLTNPEFRRQVTGCIDSKRANPESNQYVDNSVKDLPDEVDWTKKGVVAPIKNQGNCGSCWAFSAVASMESQHALHSGKLVELSEQELVDCSFKAEGCEGGWPIDGFKFAIENKGMDTEASYPYKAVDQTCQDSIRTRDIGARFTNFSTIASGDENALQSATAKVGPISVLIDASSSKFQHYKSGVYDNEDCAQDWLDHAVTVVGYGTLEGTQYWKVKNSWGTDWGMAGYILMSRNKDNQCGIATSASYPIV